MMMSVEKRVLRNLLSGFLFLGFKGDTQTQEHDWYEKI
jgi:hypothetical protein